MILTWLKYLLIGAHFLLVAQAQDVPAELKKLHHIMETHTYRTDRPLNGFNSYSQNLGPQFLVALTQLRAGQRWLDIGAGQGNAMVDYLASANSEASVWGLSVEAPTHSLQSIKEKYGARFNFLIGKYLEDYTLDELGTFDLITDVYGAVSYSPHLDVIVASIGQLLKLGSTAFTLIQIGDPENLRAGKENLKIVDNNSLQVPLSTWFAQFRCLSVTSQIIHGPDNGYYTENRVLALQIRRTCNEVQVPGLELLEYQMSTPPSRLYRYSLPTETIE